MGKPGLVSMGTLHAAGHPHSLEMTVPACRITTPCPVFHPCPVPCPTALPLAVPYLMKSLYSIQKTPSLPPWGISSWRRGSGQCGQSSDQLPFQEKRPQGFRSRSNLGEGEKCQRPRRGGKTQLAPHKGHPITPAFQSPPSIPELMCQPHGGPRSPCPVALDLLLLSLPFPAQGGSARCCGEGAQWGRGC